MIFGDVICPSKDRFGHKGIKLKQIERGQVRQILEQIRDAAGAGNERELAF